MPTTTLSPERAGHVTARQGAVKAGSMLWLAWERHRRSRELSNALSAQLLELVSELKRPWKYGVLAWRTVVALVRMRPAVVFVQCPSVILGVLSCLLRPVLRYRLVLDLHNECVEPYNYNGRVYIAVLKWMRRSCDVAIISNEGLLTLLAGESSRVCVLPDRLPGLEPSPDVETSKPLVVFICTFSPDEPYRQVIGAARLVPQADVYVTGNYRKVADLPADLPSNVTLCGFLPDEAYEDLLNRAHVIVDLTEMENCLVCGAYEAVALEKPLVTSDTAALRRHFSKGTVYARHTPEALAAAISSALSRRVVLTGEMRSLRSELEEQWQHDFAALIATINGRL